MILPVRGEGIDGGIDASMVEVYETGAAAVLLRSAVLELLGRMSRASLINPPQKTQDTSRSLRPWPFFKQDSPHSGCAFVPSA